MLKGASIFIDCRRMKNYSFEKLSRSLLGFNWNAFFETDNVNTQWEIIYKRIVHVLDVICPWTKYKVKVDSKPWLSNDLLADIKEKDRNVSKAKKSIFWCL